MKYSGTENSKLGDVSHFADQDMSYAEFPLTHRWPEPVKERNDQMPSLLGAEIMGGKEGDHDGNADRRDPIDKSRNKGGHG